MNILKNRKKKKGFTLIELIVVIAIIVILALIIIPQIIGYTSKASTAQVQSDARTMSEVIDTYNANANSTDQISNTATVSSLTNSSDTSVKDAATKVANDTKVSGSTVGGLENLAQGGN